MIISSLFPTGLILKGNAGGIRQVQVLVSLGMWRFEFSRSQSFIDKDLRQSWLSKTVLFLHPSGEKNVSLLILSPLHIYQSAIRIAR